jgi:hypothetical protein
VDREAAKEMKTRVLHPGREGVERVVPVLPKRAKSSRAGKKNPAHSPQES